MNWVGGARYRAQQQQRGGGFYRARGGGPGGAGAGYQGGYGRGQGRERGGQDQDEDRPCLDRCTNVENGYHRGRHRHARGRVGTLRGQRHVYYDPARHEHLFNGNSRGDDKKYSPLLDFIARSDFPWGAALSVQLSHQMEIDRAEPGTSDEVRMDEGDYSGSSNMEIDNASEFTFSNDAEHDRERDRAHHHSARVRDQNASSFEEELRGFSEELMSGDDDISLFTSDTDQDQSEYPVPPPRWSQNKIQEDEEEEGAAFEVFDPDFDPDHYDTTITTFFEDAQYEMSPIHSPL